MNSESDQTNIKLNIPWQSKKFLAVLIAIAVVLIAVAVVLIVRYESSNHSIYSSLSTENYSGANNVNVSFQYPSVMKFNSQLVNQLSKDNTPIVYTYAISSNENMNIALNYQSISQVLSTLKISPSDFISQVKAKSGSYITLLNQKDPQAYAALYGNCPSSIVNNKNQTLLICTSTNNNIITTKLIGANTYNQYTLYLVMPQDVWNQNQETWQKVEKSFTF